MRQIKFKEEFKMRINTNVMALSASNVLAKNQNTVQSDRSYRCMMTVSDGQIVYKY